MEADPGRVLIMEYGFKGPSVAAHYPAAILHSGIAVAVIPKDSAGVATVAGWAGALHCLWIALAHEIDMVKKHNLPPATVRAGDFVVADHVHLVQASIYR